jgi:hypothetical protein
LQACNGFDFLQNLVWALYSQNHSDEANGGLQMPGLGLMKLDRRIQVAVQFGWTQTPPP